ncbi:carbohydrate ABC transporter permease [Sporolactobacillus vineae]|uniref:carbohydrate ABC transporter permease n=1 Tax=Sporolactobacillus vineae TaxID=444463 RepID=UPI0002893643|nr:sugar ABC transporter permease [Sporolactobacillus vineae]
MKKAGWQPLWFILPTLLFIAVFSIWPIIQSFTYTFFDYQLNNQQKSGLYLSDRYNFDLFNETQTYVKLFMSEDRPHVTAEADRARIDGVLKQVDAANQQFKGKVKIQKISSAEEKQLSALDGRVTSVVQQINSKYKTPNGKNLAQVIKGYKESFIKSNFIGFRGYAQALTDPRLGNALWKTTLFTVVSVFIEFVLGLFLAMIMNKAIRGQGFIRTTSLIPWAIPTAVAALMWSYLYDGSSGIVANFFEKIGLVGNSSDLLLSAGGAMVSTIIADVWKTTPYMAILLLAGLQNIPESIYEAADIDGANKWQRFFRVTLPMLKPAILVALLFRTLDAFRVFDLIYVLTNGGPGGATESLSLYAYKTMFGQTNFGYGSVIVMLMFVCVAIIAVIFVKVLGTNLMDKN